MNSSNKSKHKHTQPLHSRNGAILCQSYDVILLYFFIRFFFRPLCAYQRGPWLQNSCYIYIYIQSVVCGIQWLHSHYKFYNRFYERQCSFSEHCSSVHFWCVYLFDKQILWFAPKANFVIRIIRSRNSVDMAGSPFSILTF